MGVEDPLNPFEPFVALCDIESIGASCSSTFNLPQGKLLSYFGIIPSGHLFDVPNALLGMLYYIVTVLLDQTINSPGAKLFLASAGMSISIYLAIVLTVLSEFCIVCWSTHAINALLFFSALQPFLGVGVKAKKA